MTGSNRRVIKAAAGVLRKGGLVVFPSDTVYGLAVDPTNQRAVDRLLAFKNRWTGKAISVAAANKKMAGEYVVMSKMMDNIFQTLLPGPFTVVGDGRHRVAKGIEAEDGSLGIRWPKNELMVGIVKEFGGPMTATSANLAGRTPHYSVESFLETLSNKKRAMIDLVIDGGKLPRNKPSTVIDARTPEVKVLRKGDLISRGARKLVSKSVGETQKIAEFLWGKARGGDRMLVFGLSGDLGTGKTVFSKKIGKLLGIRGIINSPTFTIYNEYAAPGGGVFLHFDLYRLTGKHEFEELGFSELFNGKGVACIEWPENMGREIFEKLRKRVDYVAVNFEYVNEVTREINFEMHTGKKK